MKYSVLKIHRTEDAGYLAVAAVAKKNFALGLNVIADTDIPLEVTRRLWTDTVVAANASLVSVETVCNDKSEHKRRVESRIGDIPALVVLNLENVEARQ